MPTKAADYLDEKTLDGLNKDEPSNRELADGLKLIIRKLWSREELDDIIAEKHRELCEHCPLRNPIVPVKTVSQNGNDDDDEPEKLTRRHVMIALIKSPWFWIPVATVCAIVLSKYNLSLPMVGGAN